MWKKRLIFFLPFDFDATGKEESSNFLVNKKQFSLIISSKAFKGLNLCVNKFNVHCGTTAWF